MLRIIKAENNDHYRSARNLFQQYAASLDFDLEFQDFNTELQTLPGAYGPPGGCILLAVASNRHVGTVALRAIDSSTCEMKRLFVIPQHRKMGIGGALARSIVREAAKLGYKRMRLDTVASMSEANALYVSLGFRPIAPYCFNPLEHAAFYELNLV